MKKVIFLLVALFSLVIFSVEKVKADNVKSEIVYADVSQTDITVNDFQVSFITPMYGVEKSYCLREIDPTILNYKSGWVLFADVGLNTIDCNHKTNTKYLKKAGTEVMCYNCI